MALLIEDPKKTRIMCRVSEKTILKANARMKEYRIGQNRKVSSDGFTVNTHVHGKTYSHTFTEDNVNAIFGRALSNMESRHGKTL